MMNSMITTLKHSKFKKYLLPLAIVILTIVLFKLITNNPPKSKRGKPSKAPQISVETKTIKPQVYPVLINSFGTVAPRTQSKLLSQVSGQVVEVSSKFRPGGFFEKGEMLVQLDQRDYLAEVNIAKASYVSASQNLKEEQARVKQAKADWQRLGNGSSASDLVLRKPQLEAAQAKMLSAQAQLEKANLALERTTIVAPYRGRVLSTQVDVGQVVGGNSTLGQIYAIDSVEVRLPIKNKDLALIDLPAEFYGEQASQQESKVQQSTVTLHSDLIGEQRWQANLVRTEGAIDSASQQLYVVAQIDQPFKASSASTSPIKMGQYVTAEIVGKTVAQALVIPSSAIYQGSYVYIVDREGLLKRKNIELSWQNGLEAIVAKGLNSGDELVLTSLGQVNSGTPVSVEGKPLQDKKRKGKPSPEKLKQMAAEKGISVEELLAQRKARRAEKATQGER